MKLKPLLILINIIILLIILFAGFWPFEFKPANNVRRLNDNKGIILIRNNQILEADILSYSSLLSNLDNNTLIIEIRIKPYSATKNWLSNILCFYDDKDPEIFMMAKWKSELILRRRVQRPSGEYAYHEVGVTDAFITDKTALITVSMDASGTTVYIDGKKASLFPRYILNPMNDNLSNARLLVGNDPRIRVPWEGEIQGLAIYRGALNQFEASKHYVMWLTHDHDSLSREKSIIALYPMNEPSGPVLHNIITWRNNLIIPGHLHAIKKMVLSKPWVNYWREIKYYSDITINIMGFIPLGFFLPALFRVCGVKRKSFVYITAIFTGFSISLAIELIQVYMPFRSSSLTDLVCNTLGTILGVVVFEKSHAYISVSASTPLGNHVFHINKQKNPD
ncbi:MAG: VanZ family protein [Spirochaetes bacterium]|nr:VanZ family protein [Spirochaetota bacterium]